jgi:hypothetical protein
MKISKTAMVLMVGVAIAFAAPYQDTTKTTSTTKSKKTTATKATTATTKTTKSEATKNATDAQITAAKTMGQVWVNTSTKVYHDSSSQFYGATKAGKFMSEKDAIAAGYHKSKSGN